MTGPLGDSIGRRELISGGMIAQAGGIWTILFLRDLTATVAGSARRGQLVQAGRHVHLGRVVP
ncbi:MAG TPA: hypothetical protein VJO14_01135 [Bacteroidota bacterium]|nr:hypothetical protein [Bacteroidota bacterium]